MGNGDGGGSGGGGGSTGPGGGGGGTPDNPPSPNPEEGDIFLDGGTTRPEVIQGECQGLSKMVARQAVGNETAAIYTTDGNMILLPTVMNTHTTVQFSFPYKDPQGRVLISDISKNSSGTWDFYVNSYDPNTGYVTSTLYTVAYMVHSHPVGGNYDSDNPSPEDMYNASQYPGMKQFIVNENNKIEFDSRGVISSLPNTCPH